MPSVKEFKKNQKATDHSDHADQSSVTLNEGQHEATEHKIKRRPGRDSHESHEEHSSKTHTEVKMEQGHKQTINEEVHPKKAKRKIEISFFGSEILRAKMPKPFKVAEAVATDWVNNGKFENLHLGSPLAEQFAKQGLKKAKEVEKKIVESGVVEKVTMKALTLGMKAQTEINNIRQQVKYKFGRK